MRYLDALAAGDFAAIDDLRSEPLEPAAETVLAQAFAGASEYVRSPRIDQLVEERRDGHGARDRRARRRGAARSPSSWPRRAAAGCSTGSTSAALTVSTPLGDSAWVGDALAPVAAPILLLPAVYPVVSAPRGLLDGEESAIIADGPAEVALDADTHARGDRPRAGAARCLRRYVRRARRRGARALRAEGSRGRPTSRP